MDFIERGVYVDFPGRTWINPLRFTVLSVKLSWMKFQAITAAYCPLVDAETLLRLSDVICFPFAHSVLIQVRTSETPNRPEEDH